MADETKAKSKVEFPERESDGCTHCGTVLSVFNNDGSPDVAASEAAQAAHAANASCPATPTTIFANSKRGVDKKSGRLEGEYAPAFTK